MRSAARAERFALDGSKVSYDPWLLALAKSISIHLNELFHMTYEKLRRKDSGVKETGYFAQQGCKKLSNFKIFLERVQG